MESVLGVTFGQRFLALRKAKGMSQGDIEKRTGLLRCYLSRVENGHTVPSLAHLERLARGLDVHVAEFFPRTIPELPSEIAALTDAQLQFLCEVNREVSRLTEKERSKLVKMIRKWLM